MIVNVLVDGVHRLPIESPSKHRADIVAAISLALNQSPDEFYLIQNGKLLRNDDDNDGGGSGHIDSNCLNGPICVHQRALGGKGGFGSMLRAIGAQIEKTTNREACRDLSGRRLRDINEEKRLKEYLEKQKDRDDDEASKIARKIERLRSKPKHEFTDTEYFETRSNLLDDVSNALEDGLKKAATAGTSSSRATATATSTSAISSGSESSRDQDSSNEATAASGSTQPSHKRKNTETMLKKLKTKKKKKTVKGALWLDEGLSSGDSSDDDDDDDNDDDESPKSDRDDDKDGSNSNSSSTKTDKK